MERAAERGRQFRRVLDPLTVSACPDMGDQETKASVANKFSRGQFSAIFFVDTLKAIGIEKVDLEDV